MAHDNKSKPIYEADESRMMIGAPRSTIPIPMTTTSKMISKQAAIKEAAFQKAIEVFQRQSIRTMNPPEGTTPGESIKPSKFFCLPVEVRNMIYKMVFHTDNRSRNAPAGDSTTIEVCDPRMARRIFDSGDFTDHLYLHKRHHYRGPRGPRLNNYTYAQLDFLRCCRQIMLEAGPIFWKTTTFRFAGFSALSLFLTRRWPEADEFKLDGQSLTAAFFCVRNVEIMPSKSRRSQRHDDDAEELVKLLAKAPNVVNFAVVHDVDSTYMERIVPSHEQCVCANCQVTVNRWDKLMWKETSDRARRFLGV